jgi:hypothetical protein
MIKTMIWLEHPGDWNPDYGTKKGKSVFRITARSYVTGPVRFDSPNFGPDSIFECSPMGHAERVTVLDTSSDLSEVRAAIAALDHLAR